MTFTPTRLAISNITQALPAVVTTSTDHNLTTGQIVRVKVPDNYGMVQLNNLLASITILSSTTFSLQYSQLPPQINVNSTTYTAFTTPAKPGFTAEILPVGSGPTPILDLDIYARNKSCETLLGDATSSIGTSEQPF